MAVSWLVLLLAIGIFGTLVVGLVVLGVTLMTRSRNRDSDTQD